MVKHINIFIFGKKYEVPESSTIMSAMEYAGYELLRGCGCRCGFCGACSAIYRIKGEREIKVALACQTQVAENMYISLLPFFPVNKAVFDISEIRPDVNIMMHLYPEIYSCIGCNSCTKGCPQDINVMQYIAYAQRSDYVKCAKVSFECVMCGICASRCPAGISQPQTALLARRLYGKYIAPNSAHLEKRVSEIARGEFDIQLNELICCPISELKELYDNRDIET